MERTEKQDYYLKMKHFGGSQILYCSCSIFFKRDLSLSYHNVVSTPKPCKISPVFNGVYRLSNIIERGNVYMMRSP